MSTPAMPPSAQQLLARAELLLLWIMITSRNDQFNPGAPGQTAANILTIIANNYNVGRPKPWNWDNLGVPFASQLASSAITLAVSHAAVAGEFQKNLSFTPPAQQGGGVPAGPSTGAQTGWDPSSPSHPSVADLKTALGLT